MFYFKKLSFAPLLAILFVFLLNGCSSKQIIHNSDPVVKTSKTTGTQPTKISAKTKQKVATETVVYKPTTKETYTVKEGDTLWEISTYFLRDPWLWPEIWYKNPQIKNPHLIYPGDQLAIIYIKGQKRIQLINRGDVYKETNGLKVVKISPRVHSKPIDSSIPSIPIESIRQLLSRPILTPKKELDEAAYILSSREQHLANSTDDIIYVRGIDPKTKQGRYHIFRPNKTIVDPITKEVYGFESLYLGEAKIIRHGDPASLRITSSTREILRNDRLIPVNNSEVERDLFPIPPEKEVDGRVISILDGISQVGQYDTIAINLGARDDIRVGHLVQIDHVGNVVKDINEADPNFLIKLPNERSAIAIVIKSYEKMSFCLILEATSPVRLDDLIVTP